jgi:hypothetical protein
LLPSEDATRYEAHVAEFFKQHAREGDEEQTLVQSLADTQWRLLRIPSLEMGIYALGRLEFVELFAHEEEATRKHLLDAKIFITYQRQLNNLGIQENRPRRQREKDSAALEELQNNRKGQSSESDSESNEQLDVAARIYIVAVQTHCLDSFDPKAFGFEFSKKQIEARALQLFPTLRAA